MSAADRREELEAAIHQQLTRAWKYGLRAPSDPRGNGSRTPAQAILAAADAYAQACADDAWAAAEGQARLAAARAEHSPDSAARDEAGRFSAGRQP